MKINDYSHFWWKTDSISCLFRRYNELLERKSSEYSPLIAVGFKIDFLIVKIALILFFFFILHTNSKTVISKPPNEHFFLLLSVQFIRLRARAVVLRHSFALNITIMDRITLFDIEINTLFEFAYNLFFVYSVSFSKRLMNKAKPDDIQLWRKSEYKTFPSMRSKWSRFDLSDAETSRQEI